MCDNADRQSQIAVAGDLLLPPLNQIAQRDGCTRQNAGRVALNPPTMLR